MTQTTQTIKEVKPYKIETRCKHAKAYMNNATGVKRCPTCQSTRHRIFDGITATSGRWEWRQYGDYHISSEHANNARLANIETCFD